MDVFPPLSDFAHQLFAEVRPKQTAGEVKNSCRKKERKRWGRSPTMKNVVSLMCNALLVQVSHFNFLCKTLLF